AYITDGTGEIELVWFQGARWIDPILVEGKNYLVYGKPNLFRGEFSIVHPEISLLDAESKEEFTGGKMQPVYSSTEKLSAKGLHSRGIEKLVRALFSVVREKDITENLPEEILSRNKFLSRYHSFEQIHFPADENNAQLALNRF